MGVYYLKCPHWGYILFIDLVGALYLNKINTGNKYMSPSRELPQVKFRVSSKELKNWIADQAKINNRTLTGEINFHLEQARLKQQKDSKDET